MRRSVATIPRHQIVAQGQAPLPEDGVERLHQLGDVGRGAGIECRLDDRLVGARPAAEGALEGRIGTESGVDF